MADPESEKLNNYAVNERLQNYADRISSYIIVIISDLLVCRTLMIAVENPKGSTNLT